MCGFPDQMPGRRSSRQGMTSRATARITTSSWWSKTCPARVSNAAPPTSSGSANPGGSSSLRISPRSAFSRLSAASENTPRSLLMDDGSGPGYAEIFEVEERQGAVVIWHDVNQGRSAALRTDFGWLMLNAAGHTVVWADSDGQHLPADVLAVGAEVEHRVALGDPAAVVLGGRGFSGRVPMARTWATGR